MRLLGRPSITPIIFYTGKLAFLACLVVVIARPWCPRLVWFRHPLLEVLGAVALIAGLGVATAGLTNLGASTRMGLPAEQTALKTHGVYRYTRNPVYVGAYLIGLAAVCWTANPAVAALVAVVVAVHHRIILAEEKYLRAEFGDAYVAYARRVRRYL